MQITLIDGMSVVRARLERDMSRFSIRNWLLEIDASRDYQIWCWDGANNKAVRQAIYPGYKLNRKPADASIFKGIDLFRTALSHTKAAQVNVPAFEADDVIAAIAMKAAGGGPIHIMTRDYDLRALVTLADNITCDAKAKDGVDDADIRIFKTFVGDPSDNVKGVKLFGPSAWKECDPEVLRTLVLSNEPVEALLEHLPKDTHREWVRANFAELKAMWAVTGFIPVPDDLINANLTRGISDALRRDGVLSEFFL